MRPGRGVVIRPYRSDDATATVEAWCRPAERNVPDWDEVISKRGSAVAIVDDEIAGFSDVSAAGYIVDAEQHPLTAGIRMTNYRMSKPLGESDPPESPA
jgi:hypothetical protein